jgi:multimeric flavodoxin WrbA
VPGRKNRIEWLCHKRHDGDTWLRLRVPDSFVQTEIGGERGTAMKVIGINGSPRPNGNTSIIIREVFRVLEENGIETELVQLGGSAIRGCTACGACFKTQNGTCAMQGDGINAILKKAIEADGIILGSPVYFADVTPEMKAFIERTGMVATANGNLLKYKVSASAAAVRRAGAIQAFDTMNHFLHYTQTFLVGASYWNMVYGKEIGEVQKDEEGMENMRVLGENMAWLLKKIHG